MVVYRVAILEMLQHLLHNGLLFLQLLHFQRLTAASGQLDKVLVRLLDEFNVLDAELVGDNLQVTDRVYVTLDVDDLCVVETSDDLEDGIDGADV